MRDGRADSPTYKWPSASRFLSSAKKENKNGFARCRGRMVWRGRCSTDQVFGDKLLTCPQCQAKVAATLISDWGVCPVCRTVATNELTVEALEIRRRAAMAAGQEVNKKVEQIERLLYYQQDGRNNNSRPHPSDSPTLITSARRAGFG